MRRTAAGLVGVDTRRARAATAALQASAGAAPRVANTARPRASERRSHAERREEAEGRLLEAALLIVATRGTVRMTLAEVGEAAGYSRGLAAHRFGSKAGLVRTLATYIGERFRDQRERGPAFEPGLQALLGNIHFYFSRNGSARVSARALLVMMSECCMDGDAELRRCVVSYNRKALAWFEQHIRVGIASGEIAADADPAATALVVLGAMRGVMQQWLVDDRVRLLATRDRLLQIVEATLRAR